MNTLSLHGADYTLIERQLKERRARAMYRPAHADPQQALNYLGFPGHIARMMPAPDSQRVIIALYRHPPRKRACRIIDAPTWGAALARAGLNESIALDLTPAMAQAVMRALGFRVRLAA